MAKAVAKRRPKKTAKKQPKQLIAPALGLGLDQDDHKTFEQALRKSEPPKLRTKRPAPQRARD
jgi:hypothetical protein